VQVISEAHLLPVIEQMLEQFPESVSSRVKAFTLRVRAARA